VSLLAIIGFAAAAVDWPFATRRGIRVSIDAPKDGAGIPLTLAILGLEILPRSEWSAAPPSRNMEAMKRLTRLTIHHQGATAFESLEIGPSAQRIRSIQHYHQSERGWADIGYHLIIDRAGRLWEGRSIHFVGAHAGDRGGNRQNAGVVLLGNYETQTLTRAQEDSLRQLLDRARDAWKIPMAGILTHNEVREESGVGSTQCPGRHLVEFVRRYREKE
jgi:hypothetical protein